MDRAEQDTSHALRAHELVMGDVDAPLALCSATGELQLAAPAALFLLQRLGVSKQVPTPLPGALWQTLENTPLGEPVEWQASAAGGQLVSCTRYGMKQGGFLLWLRELPASQASLSESEQRLRQAAAGRLMASVAHDVRSSVASIVYSADFLDVQLARGAARFDMHSGSMKQETVQDTARDICDASRRLQLTVDGLLDYARLGPAISVPVSLPEVLNRAQGLLRSFAREGVPRLRIELAKGADWVRGNPVVVEQIFVNLLLSCAERTPASSVVTVSSTAQGAYQGELLLVRVSSDGSAADAAQSQDPHGARLAARLSLLDARAAAQSQGGELLFEERPEGPIFTVQLPRSEGPR